MLGKIGELAQDALLRAGVAPKSRFDPGAQLVEQARTRYFDLDFDGTIAHAEQALAHYTAHPGDLGDGSGWVFAHVFAALAELERGAEPRALDHLVLAVTVRPELRLLESEFSPTALALLERARDLAARQESAPLTVSSAPAFARVRIDGRPAGETPLTYPKLTLGQHFVQLEKEGFVPVARWVRVSEPGAQVSFELIASPAAQLRQELALAISEGRGDEVPDLARRYAEASELEAVFLFAVAREGDGYVLTGGRVPRTGAPSRAVCRVSKDLTDAVAQVDALIAALFKPGPVDDPVVVGNGAPGIAVDFGRHWMGLRPPPPEAVGFAEPPALEPMPLYKRPWVWVAAGVVAAAAGSGIYFATRPPPPSPGVSMTVHLPQ